MRRNATTRRDHYETLLLENFRPHLRPLGENCWPRIAELKDGGFGMSYLGMLLYLNGWNRDSRSTCHPRGLFYDTGTAAFGVGCFVKDDRSFRSGIHLVAPRGRDALKETSRFARLVTELAPGVPVYARHLTRSQLDAFGAMARWVDIHECPWHREAPSEDETYCHRRITLADLQRRDGGGYRVLTLKGWESRSHRTKARLAHNRFSNFLERNKLRYSLVPYAPEMVGSAKEIVREHFSAVARQGTLIGSSAADYRGLVDFVPSISDQRFMCRVGYLVGQGLKVPVSFFAAEDLGEKIAGCYATVTRRDPSFLSAGCDERGFSAISQFSLLRYFRDLMEAGFEIADLGGSETQDLDRFKRQLGAKDDPTFWAVYEPSLRTEPEVLSNTEMDYLIELERSQDDGLGLGLDRSTN